MKPGTSWVSYHFLGFGQLARLLLSRWKKASVRLAAHPGTSSILKKQTTVRLRAGLRQRCAVRLNLSNRLDDVIHVAAIRQEQILGHRDRRRADLPVAFEFLETLAPGFEPFGAEQALESARVDRLVEQAVEILLLISA